MKKLIKISAMLLLAGIVLAASSAIAQELRLDKYAFSPSEKIAVHFRASSGYHDSAWVGIIPSHVPHGSESKNDKHDISYQHLNKRASGTLVFKAPSKPGKYDFRMNDNDNNGREVASVSFTVGYVGQTGQPAASQPAVTGNAASLKLSRTNFRPGDAIQVHFTTPPGYADNAWVGIIPSQVPHGSESKNDQHDVSYQYLKRRTSGTLVFKAPSKPGSYDFRMHNTDNNGREVASVSFTVGQTGQPAAAGNGPSLKLNKRNFRTGESIQVYFTAPSGYANNAWVGIIPSNVPHGSESQNDRHDVSYQYLKKRTSGTLVFKAPSKPGKYDFRMHNTDNNGREVATVFFTVSN